MEPTSDVLAGFHKQLQHFLDNPPPLESRGADYDRNETCERCDGYIHAESDDGPVCRCDGALKRCIEQVRRADPQALMFFDSIHRPDETIREAIGDAKLVVAGELGGLAMFGKAGLGKTHVAIAACRLAISQRQTAAYYNMVELVSRIQSTYSGDGVESRDTIIQTAASRDIIVLDDLGKEHRSENVDSIIYELINAIYCAGRRLIVCSNLTPDTYRERYDEAVRSRIAGLCEIITVKGRDRRRS